MGDARLDLEVVEVGRVLLDAVRLLVTLLVEVPLAVTEDVSVREAVWLADAPTLSDMEEVAVLLGVMVGLMVAVAEPLTVPVVDPDGLAETEALSLALSLMDAVELGELVALTDAAADCVPVVERLRVAVDAALPGADAPAVRVAELERVLLMVVLDVPLPVKLLVTVAAAVPLRQL